MDRDGSGTGWLLVAELVALSALSNAFLIAPASVLPQVRADLAISAAAAGWLVSAVFGVQILVSVPAGVALDRLRARRLVAAGTLGLAAAGAGSHLAGAAGAFPSLVAARLLGGAASVVIWNAGVTIIGRTFDAGGRGAAIGVFTAGAPAGFAVAQAGGPLVAGAAGWPAALAVFGLLALGPFGAFWRTTAGLPGGADGGAAPTPGDVRRALADRRVGALCAMGFAASSLFVLLNSWLPSYLAEELGVPLARSGLLVALFPAVGVLARGGGGVLSDRVFESRRRPVTVLSFAATTPAVLLVAVAEAVAAVLALVLVAGFFIQLCVGLLFAYVREVVAAGVAGTAVALLTGFLALGAFTAPVIAGALIDATGSYRPAFGYAVAVAAIGLALAYGTPDPHAGDA